MQLSPGQRLGAYEILAPLGVGGMGEVYRAKDTRLDREVAMKVLPGSLAQDHERILRFAREAKVLASLNHPNIAQIYGVEDSNGVRALVMELVPGETLSSRLKLGPLPLAIALNYAKQIAEALEAAHDKGIVHRDLKPANIMITPAGVMKVLDFGLAAITQPAAGSDSDPANSPTRTESGMIMGTAAYMSPEQASGRQVDKRADIWAFGVVVWEMVTGKRLFEGDTVAHILAAVLTKEPELDRVPERLRRLLRSCLQRDVNLRLRDIGDARLLIEEADGPSTPARIPRHSWLKWLASATAIALLASLVTLWRFARLSERPLIRFDVELGTNLEPRGRVAISPDGSRIAFVGRDAAGKSSLLTRRLDQANATVLDDNLGRGFQDSPFFSPDSKWVGYGGDHKLKKIPVEGGLPVIISDGLVAGGESSWGDNDQIVSALTYSGLSRMSAAGGASQLILSSPMTGSFLPGGKKILLSRGGLSILPLDGGKRQPISGIKAEWAQYVPAGYILYLNDGGVLEALPFDAARLETKGPAFPLLDNIDSFDISATGTLLCRRGKPKTRIVQWVDESGKTEPILQTPALYGIPQLSPDGRQLALTIRDDKTEQIWIYDLERRALRRLTFGDSRSTFPQWMPGGKDLLFGRSDGVFVTPADGSGKARRILETNGYPDSISPDGRTLALTLEGQNAARDIWLVPLHGEGETLQAGKPEPFINGSADEITPSFSPDGKWLAYSSTQSGLFTIYVRSLKNTGATWQVATEEGYLPEWSLRAKEIIFRSLQGDGLWVSSYSVNGDTFVPGAIRPFGGTVVIPPYGPTPVFAVSPTSNRIAAIAEASDAAGGRPRPNYILILNFFEEIKRHAAQAGPQ